MSSLLRIAFLGGLFAACTGTTQRPAVDARPPIARAPGAGIGRFDTEDEALMGPQSTPQRRADPVTADGSVRPAPSRSLGP